MNEANMHYTIILYLFMIEWDAYIELKSEDQGRLPQNSVIFSGEKIFDLFFKEADMMYLLRPTLDNEEVKSKQSDVWAYLVASCFDSALMLY